MTARLTVLGGSSPYTVALIDALATVGGAAALTELTLYGRDPEHLGAVANYARARLAGLVGGVRVTRRLEEALEGATLVVHQIRYGDMAGRAADESFAETFGVHADETLGPAALRCALRMAPAVTRLGRCLTQTCPDAWVINLVNPLSVSTAILAASGARCLGVCELPRVTAELAATRLELSPDALAWAYDGLNHRGFVHDLTFEGRAQLPRLVARLGDDTLNGVARDVIDALEAIPLKYFRLLERRRDAPVRRAAFLMALGRQIFRELRESAGASPPSLAARDLRWYPDAVVPAILALTSSSPRRMVVNVPQGDVVAEIQADVCSSGITPVRGAHPSHRVAAWIDAFTRHERAVLRAVATPSVDTLTTALAEDPLLANVDPTPLARALCRDPQREESASWTSS